MMYAPELPPDTRHPRERERDQHLWAALFGGHSPSDEVRGWGYHKPARDIAEAAWREYGAEWDDLDREDTIDSLARTLHFEGGAPVAKGA